MYKDNILLSCDFSGTINLWNIDSNNSNIERISSYSNHVAVLGILKLNRTRFIDC